MVLTLLIFTCLKKNKVMKANEAPEKIWIHELSAKELDVPLKEYHIEYTRTDAFIEKAAEWIKNKAEKYIIDTPLCSYFDYKRAIEEFKEAMKI